MPLISVSVKHGKAVLRLEIEPAMTILDVMKQIEQRTGVPVPLQKLIQAGKVLDPKLTLEHLQVKSGARWMLLAAAQGQTRVSPAAGGIRVSRGYLIHELPPCVCRDRLQQRKSPRTRLRRHGRGWQHSGRASRGVGLGHPHPQALRHPQPQ